MRKESASKLSSLQQDAWLAGFLGKPCYRLPPSAVGDVLCSAPDWRSLGPAFVQARVPAGRIDQVLGLQAVGFGTVDTNIRLRRRIDVPPVRGDCDACVRLAVPADLAGVEMLAATAFTQDRFHLDPAIPAGVADRIKSAWAGNFFAGRRGDWMVVAQAAGRVVGFLQLMRDGADGLTIDLTAVDPSWRGRGLGRAMIGFALERLPSGGGMTVGTQAANTGALCFYETLGFRALASEYVLHLHIPAEDRTREATG